MASLQQAFVTRIRVAHAIGAGEWHPDKTISQSHFYAAHLRGSKFCYVEAFGPVLTQGTELNMADFDATTGGLGHLIFRQRNLGTALQSAIVPLAPSASVSSNQPMPAQDRGGANQQVLSPGVVSPRRGIMDITRDMCR